MLISQLEAKIEAIVKQMDQLEDQILEVNKSIDNLTVYRNKLLELKGDLWWECEDVRFTILKLKEEFHL